MRALTALFILILVLPVSCSDDSGPMGPSGDSGAVQAPTAGSTFEVLNGRHPDWSAVAGRIAYALGDPGEIWTATPTGESPAKVSPASGNYNDPSWSPDGTKLVCYRYDSSTEIALVILPAAGGTPVQLTFMAGREFQPEWSPGGQWILFYHDLQSDFSERGLWRIPAGGGVPELIVPGGSEGAWSPDGTKICYGKGINDDERGVFVAGPDGANSTRIATSGSSGLELFWHFAWSPDGNWILGSGFEGLFKVRSTGGSLTSFLADPGFQDFLSACWSPDGYQVLYYVLLGTQAEIHGCSVTWD